MEKRFEMDQLPEELVTKIYELVDKETVHKICTLVSKTWQRLIRSNTNLTKNVLLKYKLKEDSVNLIFENWNGMQLLEVPNTIDIKKLDFSNCPKLTKVILYGHFKYFEEIPEIFQVTKVMIRIEDLLEHESKKSHIFKVKISNFEYNLKALNFDKTCLDYLDTVEIKGYFKRNSAEDMNMEKILESLENCQNLHHLLLTNSNARDALTKVSKHLKRLRTITIDHYDCFVDDILFFREFKYLKTVNIRTGKIIVPSKRRIINFLHCDTSLKDYLRSAENMNISLNIIKSLSSLKISVALDHLIKEAEPIFMDAKRLFLFPHLLNMESNEQHSSSMKYDTLLKKIPNISELKIKLGHIFSDQSNEEIPLELLKALKSSMNQIKTLIFKIEAMNFDQDVFKSNIKNLQISCQNVIKIEFQGTEILKTVTKRSKSTSAIKLPKIDVAMIRNCQCFTLLSNLSIENLNITKKSIDSFDSIFLKKLFLKNIQLELKLTEFLKIFQYVEELRWQLEAQDLDHFSKSLLKGGFFYRLKDLFVIIIENEENLNPKLEELEKYFANERFQDVNIDIRTNRSNGPVIIKPSSSKTCIFVPGEYETCIVFQPLAKSLRK